VNEAEWFACTQDGPLLDFLRKRTIDMDTRRKQEAIYRVMQDFLRGHASVRKKRLYMTACCRHCLRTWLLDENWSWAERCRSALEVAVQYGDGLATADELGAARSQVLDWYVLIEQQDFEGCARARDVADITNPLREPAWGSIELIRDLFGNPFRPVTIDPAWLTRNVIAIAEGIYEAHAFDGMPILADVLEESGCNDAEILDHCRSPAEHVRGCWVVDAILGKE
jgi:hypothetical protein